jgi:hypothetical protein
MYELESYKAEVLWNITEAENWGRVNLLKCDAVWSESSSPHGFTFPETAGILFTAAAVKVSDL